MTTKAFERIYLPVFRQVREDILYALLARFLTNTLANRGSMDLVLTLAQDSPSLQRALAEADSGASHYKTIMHRLTDERILWRSGSKLLKKLLTDSYDSLAGSF